MTAVRNHRLTPSPVESECSEAAALGAPPWYASCKPAIDVGMALVLLALTGPLILLLMALVQADLAGPALY